MTTARTEFTIVETPGYRLVVDRLGSGRINGYVFTPDGHCLARTELDAPTRGTESTQAAEQADTTPSDTPEPYTTYQDAIDVLRDHQRFEHWWTKITETHPEYGYWQKGRRELADYLETIAKEPSKISDTTADGGVIGSLRRAGGLGLRPAEPGETPGAVEPDDARPQQQDLAARPEEAVEQAAIALREALNDPDHPFTASWDELHETQREFYLRMARAVVPAYVAQVERLRYERRLLGTVRRFLDGLADTTRPHGIIQVRTQAERLAQRIVDELGHPVTDEPALGPEYREQIVTLTAQLAQAEADVTRIKTHLVTEQERLRGHLAAARADRDEARAEIRSFQLQVDRLHTIHHAVAAALDAYETAEVQRLTARTDTLTSAQPTSLDYHAAQAALTAAWPDLAGDPVYVEALVNVALMAATGGDR